MKFSFCHSFMLSYLSLCSFCLTCFLPRSLAQGRHPSECYDRLVGALCMGICVCVGAVFYIVCLCPHMSFMVCVWELGQSWGTHSVSAHLSPSSWGSVNYYLPALRRQAHHGALRWGLLRSSVIELIMHLHAEALRSETFSKKPLALRCLRCFWWSEVVKAQW